MVSRLTSAIFTHDRTFLPHWPKLSPSQTHRHAFSWPSAAPASVLLHSGCSAISPETRQAHIHHMGHHVMPFDLNRTTHVFQMTQTGGILRVVVKDPKDTKQIELVRQHLQHEAARFQKGDFFDPATLHGQNMPGIRELAADPSHFRVRYTSLATGAQLTFSSRDMRLITAIHRWFGAQLSEHGADATSQ